MEFARAVTNIEELECANDFEGGAVSLDADRKQREVNVMESAAKDTDDVANGSACGRRDQADAARQHRKGFLAIRREKAFGFETFFQLVEGEL